MDNPQPQKGLLFFKIGIVAVLTIACLFGIVAGAMILIKSKTDANDLIAYLMLVIGLVGIGPVLWLVVKWSRAYEEVLAIEALSKPDEVLLQWESSENDKIIVTKDTLFLKKEYWTHFKFKEPNISLIALKIIDKDPKKALSFEFRHRWHVSKLIDIPQEQEAAAQEVVVVLNEKYNLA